MYRDWTPDQLRAEWRALCGQATEAVAGMLTTPNEVVDALGRVAERVRSVAVVARLAGVDLSG